MSTATLQTPNPLGALVALESPLLDGLAPELRDLRDQAAAAAAVILAADQQGCASCAKKKGQHLLVAVAKELRNRLILNAELAAVFPSLLTTAKASTSHV